MADSTEESFSRCVYQEIKRQLDGIKSIEDCSKTLKEIYSRLFNPSQDSDYFNNSAKCREIFFRKFYRSTVEGIVVLTKHSWFNQFKKSNNECFESFFKEGNAEDVFLGLTNVLSKERHSNVVKECVWLTEKYAKTERIVELFWDQAKILPKTDSEFIYYDPSIQIVWDEIIKRLISLPDRISNLYKLSAGSVFWPQNFFKLLGNEMMKVLKLMHSALSASKDCSMGFLCQFLSKICIRNHGTEVYSIILPEIEKLMKLSPLWCRICHKLFSSIDEPSLDAVIEPFLIKCMSFDLAYQLFGDFRKQKKRQLKYLMTQKYLLYRFYKKDTIPFCIIGYLTKCSNEAFDILLETLKRLLDAWGSSNAIKHISYEQHFYITKCVLISIGFLQQGFKNKILPNSVATDLSLKLLHGLPSHLESPIDKLRNLGMIVAEEITNLTRTKQIEPLKFEFQRDEDAIYLSTIARDPFIILRHASNEIKTESECLKIPENHAGKERVSGGIQPRSEKEIEDSKSESDLDSDDDLEPYPMDEEDDDTLAGGVRPPVYLSECLSGLLSKDDPARFEACLFVAERIVRKEPPELNELAVEFVKVLLYLQDNYDTKNFVLLRHGAMVATAVKCPKNVIDYLSREFYEENYNLRQRMDILEVIASSALELSHPIDSKGSKSHLPLPKIPGMTPREKPDWQIVVEERIKNKTRIISHGRKVPQQTPVANRFRDVAGDFFFPLLKNFDSKSNTFDLLGKDFLVLGKLIQTLGTIVRASSGLNVIRLMTSAMLDFVWGLRYHQEPFIRQSLLYAICMCVLECPVNILIAELNTELMESHQWVTDVANNDPDSDCQKLATQTLLIIDAAIKNEFIQNNL